MAVLILSSKKLKAHKETNYIVSQLIMWFLVLRFVMCKFMWLNFLWSKAFLKKACGNPLKATQRFSHHGLRNSEYWFSILLFINFCKPNLQQIAFCYTCIFSLRFSLWRINCSPKCDQKKGISAGKYMYLPITLIRFTLLKPCNFKQSDS